MANYNVDIVDKKTKKTVATTTVRGNATIDSIDKAVDHVKKTHPNHDAKRSETQSQTDEAIEPAQSQPTATEQPPQ